MAGEVNRDEMISQYVAITNDSAAQARQYLEAFDWDLQAAVEDFYARNQESDNDPDYTDEDMQSNQHKPASGGRRLGDATSAEPSVPVASSSTAKTQRQAPTQKKFATLGDFNSAATNDDSDEDENHDLFAGGEKSGLAVQNPDDLKKRILEKAQKSGGPRPKEPEDKKSHFIGPARTLGGEDEPSREISASPQPKPRAQRVDRILHFWRDGFSVDDGDLYRIDDPRNADILNLIRQGRAPLHIMNVESGQEVDVEIKQHDENYVKPKKKYKPFEGQGNRLGSPVPGASSTAMPGSFGSDNERVQQPDTTAQPPTAQVDESKPTVTLRINMGSGARLTSRFNTDQTIGDVYSFVQRAETGTRNFVLQTTFPTTELTDKSKVLGDMPEFKRGGAVVQRFV